MVTQAFREEELKEEDFRIDSEDLCDGNHSINGVMSQRGLDAISSGRFRGEQAAPPPWATD